METDGHGRGAHKYEIDEDREALRRGRRTELLLATEQLWRDEERRSVLVHSRR